MHRMQRDCLIAGFLLSILLGVQPSEAQYTANFQTNIISGVTSNWSVVYIVGNNNFADALLIENGGVLRDGGATVGNEVGGSNNSVLVTGTGSIWSNAAPFFLSIGGVGAGNSLVISNGGVVGSYEAVVGQGTSSSNNLVLVTGPSSVWSNNNRLYVGQSGAGNSLVISNGGQVLTLIDGVIVGVNSGSNSNSVLVTDSGSVWDIRQSFMFGYAGNKNSLVISNGGMVAVGGLSYIGFTASSSNNVLVTGSGSVWSNGSDLFVGDLGMANSLVISDGGMVAVGGPSFIASATSSSNNNVLVTGSGSVWSNAMILDVGASGGANSLVISNGGQVVDTSGYVGENSSSSNNIVRVVDGGVWQNNALYVGYQGSSNSLFVAGGSVYATNLNVGFSSAVCNNLLQLDSGSVIVTNAGHTATLEVRHGELIVNGGVVRADTLVITNICAQFIHTGGTLIVGNVVLDPNTFRIVSVTRQSNDLLVTWMMGPGATNTLQATAGDGSGGYSTNGFTDIFIVTNNVTVGSITNYLDIGAATNIPSRFYRARLVP